MKTPSAEQQQAMLEAAVTLKGQNQLGLVLNIDQAEGFAELLLRLLNSKAEIDRAFHSLDQLRHFCQHSLPDSSLFQVERPKKANEESANTREWLFITEEELEKFVDGCGSYTAASKELGVSIDTIKTAIGRANKPKRVPTVRIQKQLASVIRSTE